MWFVTETQSHYDSGMTAVDASVRIGGGSEAEPLSGVGAGRAAVVESLGERDGVADRLRALGFVEGVEVKLRRAGCPCLVEIPSSIGRATVVGLRRADAARVVVRAR